MQCSTFKNSCIGRLVLINRCFVYLKYIQCAKTCKNMQKRASQVFLDPIQKRALSRSMQLETVYLKALLLSLHVRVSLRALYCLVDTSHGIGRSLGDCRPGLPKGWKYQMFKTQTESHVRRPVVWTNRWQIWVFFSFEIRWGTAGICHASLWGFFKAL